MTSTPTRSSPGTSTARPSRSRTGSARPASRVTRIPGTGLLADIGDSGPLIGLRADLDALPVEDTSGLPWASTNPGVAHACGHDVHTAGLVGAGLALAELHARGQLPGRVRLLFQPAEEVMPGGALLPDGPGRARPTSTGSSCSTATRRSTSARSAYARAR